MPTLPSQPVSPPRPTCTFATVRELAPTEKMAPDEVAFVKVEGLGRLPFSNIRRCGRHRGASNQSESALAGGLALHARVGSTAVPSNHACLGSTLLPLQGSAAAGRF